MYRFKFDCDNIHLAHGKNWDNSKINDLKDMTTMTINVDTIDEVGKFLQVIFKDKTEFVMPQITTDVSQYDLDFEGFINDCYAHVTIKLVNGPYKLFGITVPYATTKKFHCTYITNNK